MRDREQTLANTAELDAALCLDRAQPDIATRVQPDAETPRTELARRCAAAMPRTEDGDRLSRHPTTQVFAPGHYLANPKAYQTQIRKHPPGVLESTEPR